MNYNHFLIGINKFRIKNRYRLESSNNNGKSFLLFSAVFAVILTTVVTLSIETEETAVQASEQITKNTIALQSNSSHKQNIPLDLPEIGYRSEILARSVTYSESRASASKPSKDLIARSNLSQEIKVNASDDSKKVDAVKVDAVKTLTKTTVETVKNQNLVTTSQTEAEKTKTVVVKSGDTLSAIFKRLSLSASTLHQIVNSSKQAKQLTQIRPGQKLIITFNDNNKFKSLHYNINRVDTLIINKDTDNAKFVTHIESKEIDVRQQFTTATITNSLFAAGNKAGLSSAMIMKLAQLFGWDVDFALDIRKGDSFAILFEEKYIDDKKIGNGNILSAEFVNRGKTFKAIRYTDASGHSDYYSEKGLSMRKAFLRTPVEFSRISSRFSGSRKHPVLNRIRAHKGVDYAASRGTPIKSVGDGKVIFKGRKGGYGRVIILQHGSKYTTLYAHMNSYNKKIKHGSRVKQGQIIGYVGSSGLASGPHLHYEFRINGVHRNPLTVALPSASPIAKKYRTDFQITADTMISQLKSRKLETIALTEQ